jgi:hypothetical protein
VNNPLGKFQVNVVGKTNAPPGSAFTLAVLQPVQLQSNNPYTALFYENIPIQRNSVASLSIDDLSLDNALTVDINGDGAVDIVRGPTSISQCVGDVNNDGKVNGNDADSVQESVSFRCGDSQYDPKLDINHDCAIDDVDISLVSSNLHCPDFTLLSLTILDHFLCYKASHPSGFNPKIHRGIPLLDQFEDKRTDVVKPLGICNPVQKERKVLMK